MKDIISEEDYREAFELVDPDGALRSRNQMRFNEIVEEGREIMNNRQALEEMASRRWPEG